MASSVALVGGTPGDWVLRTSSGHTPVRAKYTVAADGATSKAASLLKAKRPKTLVGVQVEAPLARSMTNTMVFLSPRLLGGYGWLFPKGRAANVGLGVAPTKQIRPSELLQWLVEWLEAGGFIRPGRLAKSGGMIPVSGLRDSLVIAGVLLCGDAAGLTTPLPERVFLRLYARDVWPEGWPLMRSRQEVNLLWKSMNVRSGPYIRVFWNTP